MPGGSNANEVADCCDIRHDLVFKEDRSTCTMDPWFDVDTPCRSGNDPLKVQDGSREQFWQ